jgi:hypothetical protein
MPVLHTLAAIGRFLRGTPPPPADLLEAYAHEVIPVMDRAEWLYEYWLEQSTLYTDSEKLGNVAAIHRWETASMSRSLERVIPPAVLADAHERVVDALELASRAAQLLSNGSRFHNANAVCEGHAMLAISRERRLAALRSMRRYLARIQPATPSPANTPASETTAEPTLPSSTDAGPPAPELAAAALTSQEGAAVAAGATNTASHSALGSEQVTPSPIAHGATSRPEQTATDTSTGTESDWPDLTGIDLIVADAAEPEPDWLKAARSAAPTDSPVAPPETPAAPTPARPVASSPAQPDRPPTSVDSPKEQPASPAAPRPAQPAAHPVEVQPVRERPSSPPAPSRTAAQAATPTPAKPEKLSGDAPAPEEAPPGSTAPGSREQTNPPADPPPSQSGWGSLFGTSTDQTHR